MALAVTSSLAPEWFTPPSQADESEPAGFLLAPLSAAGFLNANAAVSADRYGDAAMLVCQEVIKGWRNVTVDGEAEFKPRLVASLPPVIVSELATEIIGRATLSETERKN